MVFKNQFLKSLWLESFSVYAEDVLQINKYFRKVCFPEAWCLAVNCILFCGRFGFVFLSRSLMPVGFLVSYFSLPLSWAHTKFVFLAQVSYFHTTVESQGSWAVKTPWSWPTKIQKFIKRLILVFFWCRLTSEPLFIFCLTPNLTTSKQWSI